jgi:hypothetical protein
VTQLVEFLWVGSTMAAVASVEVVELDAVQRPPYFSTG